MRTLGIYAHGLNKRQKMAADCYRKDKTSNKSAAYRHAYPDCSEASVNACASQLFNNPKVVAYLTEMEAKITRKVNISQEGIITDLIEMKDMALGKVKMPMVRITKDGEVIEAEGYNFDGAAAGKALELLGKNQKMFNDKSQIDGQLIVNLHLNLSGERQKIVFDQEPEQDVITKQS